MLRVLNVVVTHSIFSAANSDYVNQFSDFTETTLYPNLVELINDVAAVGHHYRSPKIADFDDQYVAHFHQKQNKLNSEKQY